ncbi:hypothetical protein D3C74_216830 [compost metagenome]
MKKWLVSSVAALSLFSIVGVASASPSDSVSDSVYDSANAPASAPITLFESKSYDSGGRGFARSWEASDSGGSGFNTWEVEYGFNKFAIDEDYIHGYHNSKGHAVKLTNGNSTFSDSDNAGSWSRVDVTHSGNSVYYNFNF